MGAIEDLGRELAELRAEVRSLKRPQLAYSSIEDGSLDEYDADGNLVGIIGKQHDGTHGAISVGGPPPPKPTAPIVTPVQGGLIGRWNGEFDGGALSPMNFSHVSLHVTDNVELAGSVLPGTLRSTMAGELGDEFPVGHLTTDPHYVWLVAWSKSGKPSAPSTVVTANPLPSVTAEQLAAAEQRIDAAQSEFNTVAGNLTQRVQTAESDITAAENRLGQAEADLTNAFGQITTVDGKAATALNSASAAQTTADNLPKVLHGTTEPSGTAPNGSIWFQHLDNLQGVVIGQWSRVSGAWVATPIGSDAIGNLDVGKLTAGSATIVELVAQKIAASTAAFQTVDIGNLTVTGTSTLANAVAIKLAADIGSFLKLYANQVIIGSGGNILPDPNFTDIDGWSGAGGIYSFDTTGGRSGGGSFLIAMSTGQNGKYYGINAGQTAKRPRVTGGSPYRASVWVRPSADVPVAGIGIYIRSYNTAGTLLATAKVPATTPASPFLANVWTLYSGMITLPDLATNVAMGLYVESTVTNADVRFSEPSLQAAMDGTLVATNSITAPHIVASAELTAKIARADMFEGRTFTGGTFTGATFQTHTAADQGVKLDASGLHAYGPQGGPPVVEVSPTGVQNFSVNDAEGSTISTIGRVEVGEETGVYEGLISSDNLNIANDPEFMGLRLFGNTAGYESPNDQVVEGILDVFPRGVVAYGVAPLMDKAIPSSSDGEMALLELEFDALPGRAYRITTTPLSVIVNGPGAMTFNIRRTTDGTRPRLTSPLIYKDTLHQMNEGTADRNVMTVGGSYYIMAGAVATNRLLFSLGSDGTATAIRVSSSTYSGEMRVVVEDIGPNAPSTGILRTDTLYNTVETAPTPPPTKKSYTKYYAPTGYRSFYTSGGHYAYMQTKMFQGASPSAGGVQSIATFPSMTGDLSGATITSIKVYFYFDHWYYNSGGTARIHLHGATSLPSTKPAMTYAVSSSGWPKPGGRWVSIPSSFWAGFKSGTYRGIGLGDTTPTLTEYGYAAGYKTRIQIKYTK